MARYMCALLCSCPSCQTSCHTCSNCSTRPCLLRLTLHAVSMLYCCRLTITCWLAADQDDAIRNLFSSRTKAEYSVGTLLSFVTIFYTLAVLTYGIAIPTGLFVPSILCGAAYGRLVGVFVADMHPAHGIDEGTYALLGAASFLGGCMRMTVCTCVMLLELTNNLALLPLVMLVLLVAKVSWGQRTTYIPAASLEHQQRLLPVCCASLPNQCVSCSSTGCGNMKHEACTLAVVSRMLVACLMLCPPPVSCALGCHFCMTHTT